VIRNPQPPPSTQTRSGSSGPGSSETEAQRAARVQALREAWLSGTLDLSIPDEASGLQRLLRDVFTHEAPPRR
jgi:hypothetical protein